MKNKILLLLTFMLISSIGFSQKKFLSKHVKFRHSMHITAGTYYFNDVSLYFFDDGIDCYLLKKCNAIDSVYLSTAKKIIFTSDTIVHYQAYLFTKNYEYLYISIGKREGWLRTQVPITQEQKNFLKKFVYSTNYPLYASYAEIIPFKNPQKVFISDADDWYIADLEKFKVIKIGTKGGRLEACQMLFKKNCVMCYIDLGWGQYLYYDENGKKCRK